MDDYFSTGPRSPRRRPDSSQQTQERLNVPPQAETVSGRTRPFYMGSVENMRNPSNIRIRRLNSGFAFPEIPGSRPTSASGQSHQEPATTPQVNEPEEEETAGRRRSMSAPQRLDPGQTGPSDLNRTRTTDDHMPPISEATPGRSSNRQSYVEPRETPYQSSFADDDSGRDVDEERAGNWRERLSMRRARTKSFSSRVSANVHSNQDHYDADVVDYLDLIDPEVRTLGTLTNLQNSLFVPDLGGLINRRPTYHIGEQRPATGDATKKGRSRAGTRASQRPIQARLPTIRAPREYREDGIELEEGSRRRSQSVSSQMKESHFAVLPHGVSLDGWTDEEVRELNDHVRHLLHSRKEGFKRSWRGFKQYVSKPLGLFVFVYATLVTLFGAAWVFCLIGWIYVGTRQDYFIDVIDNVLVALFALMGDGLAPFRAVDTYHMCFIAHYHHLTWKLREQRSLPSLANHNDLPDRTFETLETLEDGISKEETTEFSVLSVRQQRRLQYHQAKFNKAHTFYRPHETPTHHAFPLRLLVAIVVLLDCHSLFQVALGTCTWSINYKVRPEALTATILSCSITCNIVAGVLISIGDRRTRKKDVLERIFRQNITEQAIRDLQQRRGDHLAVTVDPARLAEAPLDGSAPPRKPEKLLGRKSEEIQRSVEKRKSLDARRSVDVSRSLRAEEAAAETSVPPVPALPKDKMV